MVESVIPNEFQEILKPFRQRTAEIEERVARVEAAVATVKDAGNENHLKQIDDLQSKLEKADAELVAEKEKAQKLAAENQKLLYRIVHLSRALKEANTKLDLVTTRGLLESIKLQDS